MKPVLYLSPICLPKTPHFIPLWRRNVEYPLYTPGDPQFRMFLVPFWMKLIYPGKDCSNDQVVFKVHPQMNKYDVKQYLEKIYNCPVINVRLKFISNDLPRMDILDQARYLGAPDSLNLPVISERYEKVAYVKLPYGMEFNFPNIFHKERPSEVYDKLTEEVNKDLSQTANQQVKNPEALDEINKDSHSEDKNKIGKNTSLPSWFT